MHLLDRGAEAVTSPFGSTETYFPDSSLSSLTSAGGGCEAASRASSARVEQKKIVRIEAISAVLQFFSIKVWRYVHHASLLWYPGIYSK